MIRGRFSRLVGGVCCAALAAGVLLLSPSGAQAATTDTVAAASTDTVAAASTIGGAITTSEVLDRAADWYNRAIPYNTYGSAWDLGRTKLYRTDCSGFVDMSLHTPGEPNTGGYADNGNFKHLYDINAGMHYKLTPSTIQTGDVFTDTIDGHAFLFAWWAPDHVHFAYYNFGGGVSGTAPPELHHQASFSDSTLGFEPINHYQIYRYVHIRKG